MLDPGTTRECIFDVSPFLGLRVQVRFVASEDNAKATSFFVDSVQLVVN
jgi:hypothetical protein